MKNIFEPNFIPQVKEKETLQRIEVQLTPEQMREKLRDPNFLPTREQIKSAFTDDEQWRVFCLDEKHPVFEFYNKEYIGAITNYFIARAKELGASREKPLVILEIGAGNGRLTHFLNEKIKSECNGEIEIIATDSGSWKIKPVFPVESLNFDDALKKYNPKIVVCSWMPPSVDFTEKIRQSPSVQEYVLIGEAETGCCGEAWRTWGIWDDYDDDEYYDDSKKIPLYEEDGFNKEYLDDLKRLQVCNNYESGLKEFDYSRSSTVSFKRES